MIQSSIAVNVAGFYFVNCGLYTGKVKYFSIFDCRNKQNFFYLKATFTLNIGSMLGLSLTSFAMTLFLSEARP